MAPFIKKIDLLILKQDLLLVQWTPGPCEPQLDLKAAISSLKVTIKSTLAATLTL